MTDPDPWDFSRPPSGSSSFSSSHASEEAFLGRTNDSDGWPSDRDPNPDAIFSPEPNGLAPGAGLGPSISAPSGPPAVWLIAAACAALAGLAASIVQSQPVGTYFAGWTLAGPVAIGLLTVFARVDAVRQTAVLYSFPAWKNAAYRGLLALAFVAVVCDALRIADWAGHR